MSDTVYIYGLFDPRNLELRYIGQTIDISKRLKNHIRDARYSGKLHRNNWIRQLLKEDLEPAIEILEECTKDNWQEIERAWIKEAREKGVRLTNITVGGEGLGSGKDNPLYGKAFSDERKKQIGDRVRGSDNGFYGKTHTEEMKQHYRDLFTGQKVPRERVERMAQSLRGRIKSEKEKQNISNALKGKKKSDEHRKNLSEAAKKRGYSQSTIDKMVQINTGHKHSIETIEKMRQARIEYWQRKKSAK